jgi:hypothetical protein
LQELNALNLVRWERGLLGIVDRKHGKDCNRLFPCPTESTPHIDDQDADSGSRLAK